MERTPATDPTTGFITQTFRVQSSLERQEYEKSILRSPPPGTRNFVRWIDEDHFQIGVEAVQVADPEAVKGVKSSASPVTVVTGTPGGDGLEGKEDTELQTMMGFKGLKYNKKNFSRGEAIAQLRAAGAGGGGG